MAVPPQFAYEVKLMSELRVRVALVVTWQAYVSGVYRLLRSSHEKGDADENAPIMRNNGNGVNEMA
jgi:hypothetical protein